MCASNSNPPHEPRTIARLKPDLPPIREQRPIGHILGTLDSKMDLNPHINQAIDVLARVLFKFWFVDFEPVRAKIKDRWRKGESLPGLPAEHHDPLPDRLADSDLGDSEEVGGEGARKVQRLDDGQSPPSSSNKDEAKGLQFFLGRTDLGFRYPDISRFFTTPTRTAEADDKLGSVRTSVEDINMARENCCIERGIALLHHKSGSSASTYYWLPALHGVLQLYEQISTVFGAITGNQIEALLVIAPSRTITDYFDTLATPKTSAFGRMLPEPAPRLRSDMRSCRSWRRRT